MSRIVLASMAVLVACGGDSVSQERQAIAFPRSAQVVAGNIESGHREVFFLMIRDPTTGQGFYGCSGTLIGSRTLLTAAHCITCLTEPISIEVTNQQHPYHSTSRALDASLVTIRATAWRAHPDFIINCGLGTLTGPDVALIQLATSPAASPREWAETTLGPLTGRSVQLVGYGSGAYSGAGGGRRRSGTDTIRVATGETVQTTGAPSSTCYGDSGGPYLMAYPDGVDRVIATTSRGAVECNGGGIGSRVDLAADFIHTTFAELDPDPCVADGVCADACAEKANDPDCPESCVPNGLCSTASCASPDPDCAALGAPCVAATQCAGGRCVTDPQHPDGYCSQPCAVDGDCGGAFVCDGTECHHRQLPVVPVGSACDPGVSCADRASCIQLGGGAPTCRAECDVATDCSSANCLVDAGVPGTGICAQPLASADAGSGGPPTTRISNSSGCSSASGTLPAAVLLLLVWMSSSLRVRRRE